MTITTAKQGPVVGLAAAGLRLAPLPLALAALLAAAPAHAEWRFTPTAGATETYTDNAGLADDRHAKGQFVSEAYAAFALAQNTRRLKLVASAEEHAFVFSRGGVPGTHDHQTEYKLGSQAMVIDDLLYLDASASGGPQVVSAFGPHLDNNLYAIGNRVDVSTWSISPWLSHHFGRSADLTARVTRDGVDAGRNAFSSSTSTSESASLSSGANWQTLGWGLSYMHQDLASRLAGPSSSQTAVGNLSWRLGRQLALTATGGYDKYDYQSLGGRTAGRNWSAGFVWTPSTRTRVAASAGRHFFGKTGSLEASHRSRHSVWSVHYGDVVTTTRRQFLLPSTVDTASMLDSLFAPSFPDPVARAAAVAAYMQQAGLPASLTDSINYMSNRYMRQKDFQLSAAFKGAHSDLLVGVFDTTRTALSAQESDSALLGSSLLALNDNTRQRGVNAAWAYRLAPRTTANLMATLGHTRSLSTGVVNHTNMLRVGLTHRFSHSLYGMAEVRHSGGGSGLGYGYRENAVSATVAMQF